MFVVLVFASKCSSCCYVRLTVRIFARLSFRRFGMCVYVFVVLTCASMCLSFWHVGKVFFVFARASMSSSFLTYVYKCGSFWHLNLSVRSFWYVRLNVRCFGMCL